MDIITKWIEESDKTYLEGVLVRILILALTWS